LVSAEKNVSREKIVARLEIISRSGANFSFCDGGEDGFFSEYYGTQKSGILRKAVLPSDFISRLGSPLVDTL